ncbi:hypothetical protein EMPS_05417 [Entomortierella parvispora]|uniref:RRM domain-containing protein n=1 Tax=Entomortierella parvispora TaxID=205924 RepID=A0A9P3LWH4_9FUNG|nr:hypothetical protein EMPS_05417 [Entomortierella parvispora]
MSTKQKTLYVSGFSQRSRAKDLAYEFERYGPLVRCDVPALRNNSSRPYAFVEYEDDRDARDAYNEMKDVRFEGYRLSVQFAKNTPSASWRYERGGGDDRRGDDRRGNDRREDGRRGNGSSRSPPRRGRSPPRRRRSPSPRRRSISPHESRARSPPPAESRRRNSGSRSPIRDRSVERRERESPTPPRDHKRPSRSPSPSARDESADIIAHMDTDSRTSSPRNDPLSPRRSVTP